MLAAIDRQTCEQVCPLDPAWRERIDALRARSQEGALACPECRETVVLRAGEIREHHFAHRHLANCPLRNQSAELLGARAALYEWLVKKFPGRVQLEHRPADAAALPRPIDLIVTPEAEKGRKFAFWIMDTRVRPVDRDSLQTYFSTFDGSVTWVFSAKLLRQAPDDSATLNLSTTERGFTVRTWFDELAPPPAGSLHYIDHRNRTLLTYRRLSCNGHSAQTFTGELRTTPVSEALIRPVSGEIAHPGEYEQLQARTQAVLEQRERERERQERERQERERRDREYQERERQREEQRRCVAPNQAPAASYGSPLPERLAPLRRPQRTARCSKCGEFKTESQYTIYDGRTGECICRLCLHGRP